MQSEIATKVAQALGAALGASEEKRLSEKPTQNLAAYDAYLKGEEIRKRASDPPSLRKEIGFYEQAVALDPGFAQAWAGVSIANSLLYSNSTPVPALAERARQAAEKAIALAPNRPEGYVALGTYERLVSLDYTRALEQYEKGLRVAPGDATVLRSTGLAEQASGTGMRRWNTTGRRCAWIPDPPTICGFSATRSCVCGAIPRRGRLSTVVSPSRLPTSI